MAVYAGMIDRMDQNIGRVIQDLRQHGELEHTLIVFLSDNGACAEWDPYGFDGESGPHNVLHQGDDLKKIGGPDSYVSYGSAWANACNTPWRLYKHYDHEGGIATPFILSWPGHVNGGGPAIDTPSDIIDIMATFVDISGARYPQTFKDHPILPMEGRSLVPLLSGQAEPARTLFFEHEGNRAVRMARWKLVSLRGHPWELYDFDNDRSELNNLAGRNPQIASMMAKAWEDWAERCHVHRPKTTAANANDPISIENRKERED
jgi:arylsulfatase